MIWTNENNDGWSPWRNKFAYFPEIVKIDSNRNATWVWLDWIEVRSRWGGQYKEYRLKGSEDSFTIDLNY